ncbi:MAG TPA: chemotaxis protein CheW [Syntrophales bacterium]|nr:chemotaxis protein CheW [Syntrophales bacterium]
MKKDKVATPQGEGASINWSEVRQRLEKAQESLERGATPSPQEKGAILKARARILARDRSEVDGARKFLDIIEFSLAGETYGIESEFVREVYPLKDFTPLPGTPPFVLGIVNVRGQILSVLDLKKFFSLPEKGLGQLNKVIIIHNDLMEFGVLADNVLDARPIPLETIQAAPPTVTGIGAAYLKGVTGGRMIVLDAEKILGDEKIIVHQEAD